MRALREALIGLRRTPVLTIVSVIAIGFSLFVVGLFGITAHNIRVVIESIEERVEIVAYLEESATLQQVQQGQAELEALPQVLSVRYVSKEDALAAAIRDLDEFREVYTDLETNPLPASLEVRLQRGERNPRSVELVAEHLAAYGFVEDVRYGRDWLDRIVVLRRVAGGAAAIIGAAFAMVAAIIIAAAVRIAVFARREEISIMRLVGATDGFVQRPFLIEGLISGLLGGGLALGLTYGAYELINAALLSVAWIPLAWAVAGVVAGAGFGLVASGMAVRRHLAEL